MGELVLLDGRRALSGERWVGKKALAEHYSVSTSTIDRWQRAPGFPRLKPFGEFGMVRYHLSEVAEWLADRE